LIEVVLDSNIYISGILFSGNPRTILALAINGRIKVFISPEIISELTDVLSRKKFSFSPESIQTIIREIESITTVVVPSKNYKIVSRDIDDNIIIDCAMESKAEYIITGDNDLLSLSEFHGIRIINPAGFIELYQRQRQTDG
jgi:uncharacterized protein